MRVNPAKYLLNGIFLCSVLLSPIFTTAQITGNGCPNADFSSGTFTNWVAYTGTYNSCCATVGVVAGRHTIMASPINDPEVGTTCANGPLPVIPPGSAFSARLGNSGTGAQADRLRYTMIVDSSNALFIYKYAVVMEDPSHPVSQQPMFDVRLLNQANQQIGGNCGVYSVAAGNNIPGFNSCGSLRWKNWTIVGMNLLPYIGQTVTLEFTTLDCAQQGHFGYAYIAADCMPLIIDVTYCPGDNNVILSAPPGFSSYAWETGQTTQTITLNNPVVGDTLSVTLTSFTNSGSCTVVLDAVIVPTVLHAGFEVNSPCEDLAVFSDTSTVENGYIQSWFWDFGDGSSSTAQHPSHTYPSPGTYNVTLITYSKPGQTGCSDTITKPVTIFAKPDAGFTSLVACVGNPSTFTDTSHANDPNGFASWSWAFSGGTPASDNQQNSSTTWNVPGNHNVTLTVTNTNGCVDSVIVPINSNSFPSIDFSNNIVCSGNPVNFTDLTVVNPPDSLIAWFWDFGGGNTANVQNPTHTFATGGTFLVEMLVVSADGCMDSITKAVTVYPNPLASFTAADVCKNDPVVFNDQSFVSTPSSITSWQWVFGDGGSSTLQNPTHQYASEGDYPVTLMVSTSENCTSVFSDTVSVFDYPVSTFTVNDICVNQTATFTNSSQNPSDGVIGNFVWDFGDGVQNTVDLNPTHNYTNPGTYSVTLINYSNNLSCPDTAVETIVVHPMAQADFTFNDTCDGKTVFLNDQSIGQLAAWTWDFGDGSPLDNNQSTSHIFNNDGTYTVELLVNSIYGCADSVSKQIEIFPLPVPNFTSMNVCEGQVSAFYDLSAVTSGFSITGYDWDFGDGNTGTGSTPANTYQDTGDYVVSLVVTTDKGCQDSISRIAEVHPMPDVSFDLNRHEGCYPVCVQFTNNSSIGSGDQIDTYAWSFGDGGTSPQSNPQYCFTNAGTYSVTLEATSNYGCTTILTYQDTIKSYPYPIAEFDPTPQVTTITDPIITFVNLSTGGYSWLWNFGDGQIVDNDTVRDPSHTYISAGTYNVILYAETEHGCRDSIEYTVIVEPEFTIYVPNAFTPDGNNKNDVFKPKGVGVDDYQLMIFNRWGEKVFESNNIEIGWDGKTRSGQEAPPDVYVYIIKARNAFGDVPFYKEGHFTLVR